MNILFLFTKMFIESELHTCFLKIKSFYWNYIIMRKLRVLSCD